MSYEKRIMGMAPQFTRAELRRRALEDAKDEKLELEREKQKLLLYFEILEM